MTEKSIVDAASRLRSHHEAHLIATVVAVRGSAYRRPGARMILTRFRWVAGSVSGGCLEGDVQSKGWWRTRDGKPVVVTYDSSISEGVDDDDIRAAFGLGCDGVVDVLLERAGIHGRIDALEVAERCIKQQRRGAVATVYRSDDPTIRIGSRMALVAGGSLELELDPIEPHARESIAADMSRVVETGESIDRSYATVHGQIDALVEAVLPPPRLFVFGAGHDVLPVALLGRTVGWDVVVCAPQPKFATRERFGAIAEVMFGTHAEIAAKINASNRPVCIVAGHHYERDRDNLAMIVGTRARYIGVLGPRTRTTRILGELCVGLDDPRIHAPVGLDLRAETPQEIALAILAEIQTALATAPGTSLRDRNGAIHDRAQAASPAGGSATVAAAPHR
jgi:xanthine/CO dehydrogenase XdhC/CoxF family maturation factor